LTFGPTTTLYLPSAIKYLILIVIILLPLLFFVLFFVILIPPTLALTDSLVIFTPPLFLHALLIS